MTAFGRKALDLVAYQLGWFVCILGAAGGRPWAGPLAAGALFAGHLLWSPDRRRELSMGALATPLGAASDGAVMAAGGLRFAGGGLPLWMPALWLLLSMLFGSTLEWLSGRYWLAAALGAASGPLAYWGGERLDALELGPNGAWLVAAEWALALPALIWISDRLGRPRETAK